MNVHKFVRDMYARKLYELEDYILNPVHYAKTVKVIGNSNNIDRIKSQLEWLPN